MADNAALNARWEELVPACRLEALRRAAHKTARLAGLGTGTVHKLKRETAAADV